MKKRQITVECEGGLHLRVAAGIVKEVQQHRCKVHFRCEGCPLADACSIFDLLKLGAAKGTSIEVSVEGPDEDAMLLALEGRFVAGAGI
jgi:phosphocarrier protein HPr